MHLSYFLFLAAHLLLGPPVFLAAQAPHPSSLEQTLRASRWKKRVLLVAAPTTDHPDFRQQKALLASNKAELAARDFLILDVLYDKLSPADKEFLVQKIGIRLPSFAAVLIGKDGGVKEKSLRPIAPQALFNTVDKMPMRREEMRRPAHPAPRPPLLRKGGA
ncbi:DUF4174 domain-containing protein [Hymenobacter terrenus]|uniref:DUF4174 domain-containing protein n=1 Tax=Hymenobacter terrenus TaxID=1629124 RepID=UPI000619F0E3|nr:DUF4174 domain-containing protein [Hymenobacter terrenus]